jgi:hypothetical protein
MDTPKELLRQRPLPQFGANQYFEVLYRIVFAPTRLYMVHGLWNDGQTKAKWTPKYPEVGEKWVLERWLTPFEYARCTPDEWKTNPALSVLGPYPERGEYEICHVFNHVTPDDENLDMIVGLIEASHKNTRRVGRSFENPENTVACNRIAEEQQAANHRSMLDLIENTFPAFGGVPMAGYGGARGTKSFHVELSAEDAILPVMPPPKERGKHISRSTITAGRTGGS